eukprot:scaffold23287_cov175-Amphora_coffeaeformis.AAC.4
MSESMCSILLRYLGSTVAKEESAEARISDASSPNCTTLYEPKSATADSHKNWFNAEGLAVTLAITCGQAAAGMLNGSLLFLRKS